MVEKYLQKKDTRIDDDPMEQTKRTLHFQEKEADTRDHSEKVKDQFLEAGNNTRNANQYVKLVNAHLQDRVSQLEKIKAEQNRFWEEMDMFKVDSKPTQNTQNVNSDIEEKIIIRDLSAIINRYGIEKIINALDKITNQ